MQFSPPELFEFKVSELSCFWPYCCNHENILFFNHFLNRILYKNSVCVSAQRLFVLEFYLFYFLLCSCLFSSEVSGKSLTLVRNHCVIFIDNIIIIISAYQEQENTGEYIFGAIIINMIIL